MESLEGIKEFFKYFKFTNQWNTAQRRQGDKIVFGFDGDWSSSVAEITARVGIVNIFGFGFDWSGSDYEGFITLINLKLGVKFNKE